MKIVKFFKFYVNLLLRKTFGYILISEPNYQEKVKQILLLQNDHTLLQNDHTLLQNDHTLLQNDHTLLQNWMGKLDFELYETRQKIDFLSVLARTAASRDLIQFCASNLVYSKSQILQDLLAAFLVGKKGYFCEFGASDGVALSNTYLLEKDYEWTGILAEPSKFWHQRLFQNRNCIISTKYVSSSSGVSVVFEESVDPLLSTAKEFSQAGIHAANRELKARYQVESISLFDLLKENNAPSHIDFLSIDTEGSEYRILSSFDFDKYSFGLICIEHNFSNEREKLRDVVQNAGYFQILDSVSNWDDWYVSKELKLMHF
jgi:FkbM family methyltransferase